jgi:hypothetical protein
MTSEVVSPPHYTFGSIEVIDVLEDWNLGFRLANVVKYIARCEHKGAPVQDLRKAAWYLCREIDKRLEYYGEPPDKTGLEAESILRTRTQAEASKPELEEDPEKQFVECVCARLPVAVTDTADVVGVELPDGRVRIHKHRKGVAGETITYSQWCDRFRDSSQKVVLIPVDGDPKTRDRIRRRKRVVDPKSVLLAGRIVTFLHEHVPRKFHVSELMKELNLKQSDHKRLCHYLSRLKRQGMIHRFSRGFYGGLPE